MISRHSLSNAFKVHKLGDLVEFLDHKRKPVKESNRVAGSHPYYGANGLQGYIDGFIFDEPLVLLAEDGGHFENPQRGIAYRISGKTWVNNHAHVLRPGPSIDVDYLCRVLENYDVTPWITGTTRGKLTKAGAAEIEIPLPPLVQQRRIAAVLDAVDVVRDKRRESIAEIDQLPHSVFRDLFGDTATNPFGWPVYPLADIVNTDTVVTYGIVQAGDEFTGGVPYVRTGDIVDGEIAARHLRKTDPAIARRFSRSRVNAWDIVMSIRATVGTTALVPEELDGANLTQGTARIAVGEKIDPHFALYQLRSSGTQHWIQQQVKGATFREITLARLRELPVIVPPRRLQDKFGLICKQISNVGKTNRSSLTTIERLFSSLQANAFAGTL